MENKEKLFAGVCALVVSGFSGFSKASAAIIVKNIGLGGGTALLMTKKPDQIDHFTHIIVPMKADAGKLKDLLGIPGDITAQGQFFLVGQDWAVDTVRFSQAQPVEKYLWRAISPANPSLSQPQKQSKALPYTPPRSPAAQPSAFPTPSSVLSSNSSEEDLELARPTASFEELLNRTKTEQDSRFLPKRDLAPVSLKTQAYWERQKGKFQFTKDAPISNQNEHITSVLEKLMQNYEMLKDRGRYFAYRDAVLRLKSHPERIYCVEQVRGMYRFGDKMLKKIGEILDTGTVRRVQAMDEMENLKSLKEFCSIWGIGTATADKLYKLGYRTIADLRARPAAVLNPSQLVGLEFFEDFAEKMQREEVKEICDGVERVAREKAGSRVLNVVPCGSYRRGRALCGDADVLMAFEDMDPFDGFLNSVVEALMQEGLVTHRLQVSDHYEPGNKKHSHEMFAGVAKLPGGKHRRLDIKVYPRKVFAWALVHFTGSANFNRSIRLFAKKKGFKLTDEGYFPTIRDHGEVKAYLDLSRLGHCGVLQRRRHISAVRNRLQDARTARYLD